MTTAATAARAAADSDAEELCVICGHDAHNAFCHIYREGRTISLCSPACAELFLHTPTTTAAGEDGWRADFVATGF